MLRCDDQFYAIKAALESITLGMKRRTQRKYESRFSAIYKEKEIVEIWAANSTMVSVAADVELLYFGLSSGNRHSTARWSTLILPNQSTELGEYEIPVLESETSIVVYARLIDATTKEISSRFAAFPEPCVGPIDRSTGI